MRRRTSSGASSGSDTEQDTAEETDVTAPIGVQPSDPDGGGDVQREAGGGGEPDDTDTQSSSGSSGSGGSGSEQSSGDVTAPIGVQAPGSDDQSSIQREAGGGIEPATPPQDTGVTAPIGARPATPSGRPGGTDADLVGPDGALTEAGRRQYAAQELGVRPADIVIEGDQARLTDEARRDRIQHAVAADYEDIYPGDVRVETVRDSGRLASERPVTGDEVAPEVIEQTDISLSGSAERRLVESYIEAETAADAGQSSGTSGFQEDVRTAETPGSALLGTQEREQAMVEAADRGSIGGALFTGGRGIEVAGQRGSEFLDEHVPGFDVGPEVSSGDVSVGSQLRNVVTDAPSGLGFVGGLAPKATGDIIAQGEERLGRVDINEEAFLDAGETGQSLQRGGSQVVEGIQREPVGAAAELFLPATVGKVSRTAKSTGGSAVRKSIDRVDSGGVLNSGGTDRAQLDLTPPSRSGSGSRSKSGDSGSDSGSSTTITGDDLSGIAARSDPTRGGRFPSGTSGRANVDRGVVRTRDTGDTPSGGASTSLGYRTAATEAQTAAKAPASATRTSTQTAVQTDRLGLVSDQLSRMQAASSPGWLAAGQVPSGDFEDLPTQSDAEDAVMPSVYGEQPDTEEVGVGALGTGTESEPMVDDAQEPALSGMSVSDSDEDTVQGNQQRNRADTDWLMDIGQRPRSATTSTSITTPVPDTPGLGPPNQTPGRDGPGRPRFRTGDGDDGSGETEAETGSFGFGFDTGSGDATVGWLDETVTDIGLGGTEMPGVPGGSSTGGDRASGDLPTTQLLEGDEDVEAAADLFSFGGSGDEFESFAIGGDSDDEGWFEW